MSDFVVHKGKRAADGFARHYGSDTVAIEFSPATPTSVTLADGREGLGSCLGCGHAPCMEKDLSELALATALEEYPGDPNVAVCPTDAISWDDQNSVIGIDQDACVGCGLCVVRCPYGAISLDRLSNAAVVINDPSSLITLGASSGTHPKPKASGSVADTTAPALQNLPRTVEGLNDARATLLVRNVLHELGLNARVRRRGDTNMRIDAVGYTRTERPFVAEIELSGYVLESPRALLEDVAIMNARYGFAVADIDAVSIVLAFPNVRSEYYQVFRDIEAVLGIRCRTLTLGAMIALLWKGTTLDGFAGTDFAVIKSGIDLGDVAVLNGMQEPYAGAFRPAK